LIQDRTKPIKFAVFPRKHDGKNSQIQWFEADTGVAFHYINAFEEEEGDSKLIRIYLHVSKEFDLTDFSKGMPFPYCYTLNLTNGKIDEGYVLFETLEENCRLPSGEFPVINSNKMGLKNRYFWYSIKDESELFVASSVAKVDLKTGEMHKLCIPGSIGEVSIVPKGTDEDDVYIVCIAFHEQTQSSSVFVFDGKSMTDQAITQVELPRRVPFGFHGQWFDQSTFTK